MNRARRNCAPEQAIILSTDVYKYASCLRNHAKFWPEPIGCVPSSTQPRGHSIHQPRTNTIH